MSKVLSINISYLLCPMSNIDSDYLPEKHFIFIMFSISPEILIWNILYFVSQFITSTRKFFREIILFWVFHRKIIVQKIPHLVSSFSHRPENSCPRNISLLCQCFTGKSSSEIFHTLCPVSHIDTKILVRETFPFCVSVSPENPCPKDSTLCVQFLTSTRKFLSEKHFTFVFSVSPENPCPKDSTLCVQFLTSTRKFLS